MRCSSITFNCKEKQQGWPHKYSKQMMALGRNKKVPLLVVIVLFGIPFLLLTSLIHNGLNYDDSIDFDFIKLLPPFDPDLLKYISRNHVFQPTGRPYNLSYPEKDPSEFSEDLKILFKGKKNGIFIECGANDGEFLSNTLRLERDRGWTGLLIEANPTMIPTLLSKNRKAIVVDACLSPIDHPKKIEFLDSNGTLDWEKGGGKVQPELNHVPKYFEPKKYHGVGLVECFPLYSIMAATNIQNVDYFSLDVEGSEFQILKRIPFKHLNFKVIHVEHWIAPEGKDAIENFMTLKGYWKYKETKSDFIFVKNTNKAPRTNLNIENIISTLQPQ